MSLHVSVMKELLGQHYREDSDKVWVDICDKISCYRRALAPNQYWEHGPDLTLYPASQTLINSNILDVITFVRNEASSRFQENALGTQERMTSVFTSLSQFEERLAVSERVMESHVRDTAQLVSTIAPKLSSLEERMIEQERDLPQAKSELKTQIEQLSQVVDQQASVIKDLRSQQATSQELTLQQSHEIKELTRTVGNLTETIMQLQNSIMALQGHVLRRDFQSSYSTLSRGSADISCANTDDDEKIPF